MTSSRDYYCSLKFTDLGIDLEKRAINSCCSARQTRINFVDMKQKGLLNISYLANDRENMLDNIPVTSCRDFCWSLEDNGYMSARLIDQTDKRTHLNSHINKLKQLTITMGSRCNLTCAYCNKNYSRSWALDILQNGNYPVIHDHDTYTLTAMDKVLKKLPQIDLYSGQNYHDIMDQLAQLNNDVDRVDIVGGEPFLYDTLVDLIASFPSTVKILLLTGAGIKPDKFQEKIDLIKDFKNVTIAISAETIGSHYEFSRYGNTFNNFLKIVNIVKQSGLNYKFISTLSNLTIFGYLDFVKFAEVEIRQNFCSDPKFLRISVLDDVTKIQLAEQFDKQNNPMFNAIIKNLSTSNQVLDQDRNNLSIFIKEFSSRRNIKLDFFPSTLLKWLDINVV
jgi:organic radical activating enzyme